MLLSVIGRMRLTSLILVLGLLAACAGVEKTAGQADLSGVAQSGEAILLVAFGTTTERGQAVGSHCLLSRTRTEEHNGARVRAGFASFRSEKLDRPESQRRHSEPAADEPPKSPRRMH